MNVITNKSLVNYINDNLCVEEIYAKYLNIPVSDIYNCLNYPSDKISNPLREDKDPSVSFKYLNGKLRMKDFADARFNGDIFHLVGLILGINCNNSIGFITICIDIINLMSSQQNNHLTTKLYHKTDITLKTPEKIVFISRPIYKLDLIIFSGLNLANPDYHIYPVKYAWLNKEEPIYTFDSSNPCYAYHFGYEKEIETIQLYFPLRKKGLKFKPRFYYNGHLQLLGGNYLIPNENLIITKSWKDRNMIKYILSIIAINNPLANTYEVSSVASEAIILKEEIVNALFTLYKNIILILDNDKMGIISTICHLNLYKDSSFSSTGNFTKILTGKSDEYKSLTANSNMPKDTFELVSKLGLPITVNIYKELLNL